MSAEGQECGSDSAAARKPLPKNHHYVPRFYLAQFASTQEGERKPGLWMFARSQSRPKRISPVEIARMHQYYAFPAYGGHDTRPEMLFGHIESVAAGIFERFAQGEFGLTYGEKDDFSCFVALMLVRIPADRLTVESGFAPKVEQFKQQFPERYRSRMVELAEDCGTSDENRLRQKLIAGYSLTRILRDIPSLATTLMAYNWYIRKTASTPGFVTSDRPALFHRPDRENPLGYVSMPISPTLHLVARPKMKVFRAVRPTHPSTKDELVAALRGAEPEIRVSRADPRQIKLANLTIIDKAFKYVFAASLDPALERMIATRLK